MSVDTYLKRKNLSPYGAVEHEGVRIFVAPSLTQWAEAVRVGVRKGWFSKSFEVEAMHRCGATCSH
ncbi:MAG: hypothetical protein ACC645_24185 [Pirellulales bacterium]